MKQTIGFLFSILLTFDTLANVNFIDISKISSDSKYVKAYNYIKDNKQFYDHWTNEWTYDKPKQELIKNLRDNYTTFSSIANKNTELFLLLGDISHYLYNLDDTIYYGIAVTNYNNAIKGSPSDYRCYWFLGYHYALSNVPIQAIANFIKAEKLLPADQPADFWNDYAWATAVTNMPSHCIYAMDKVKSISGKEGSFQEQLGETIYKRIISLDKDKDYSKKDIWTAEQGVKTTFTSRPLGIKILVDSTWGLSIYDYQKHQGVFIMNPPTIPNKKGKEIHYTIAILMKTTTDNDQLDDYINAFVSKYSDKKKVNFSDKYEKMIAYEIKDKNMYQDIGGGHLYMIGIERISPKYPGLLLENPVTLPMGNSNEVTYYTASESQDRFKGKIFYAIMLDSCEDIDEQSFPIFKNLFNTQIIIE
ncbi:hypothetical protein GALL_251620 [mine drainage metagenome]|uniref:Tetratricopeptide repeat protein n=1 Tax=mine drainage metagenome TaxID=410659 RepID=A0A1J5RTS0_9ZZZZ